MTALQATQAAFQQQAVPTSDQHKQAAMQLLRQVVSVLDLQPESLLSNPLPRSNTACDQHPDIGDTAQAKAIMDRVCLRLKPKPSTAHLQYAYLLHGKKQFRLVAHLLASTTPH